MDLKEKIKNLPTTPGVYLYKDSQGNILYVGKAKNLKRRVTSYFQNSKSHSPKIVKLVKHLKDLQYYLTDTEFEAFLLECKLIKEYHPLYNSKMKSPQSYVYIEISVKEILPIIRSTRDPDFNGESLYYGPYTSKNTVDFALQAIKEYFKILCVQPSLSKSLCLNYSLYLCFGMCQGGSKVHEYRIIVEKIMALLQGTDTNIVNDLNEQMMKASINLDFEAAAKYRDYLIKIKYLLNKERVIEFVEGNKKIIVLEKLDEEHMKFFLIEGNEVLFRKKYFIKILGTTQFMESLKKHIIEHFRKQKVNRIVNRNDLDASQIIYSYLHSSSRYLVILDEWLLENNDRILEKELTQFILNSMAVQ